MGWSDVDSVVSPEAQWAAAQEAREVFLGLLAKQSAIWSLERAWSGPAAERGPAPEAPR